MKGDYSSFRLPLVPRQMTATTIPKLASRPQAYAPTPPPPSRSRIQAYTLPASAHQIYKRWPSLQPPPHPTIRSINNPIPGTLVKEQTYISTLHCGSPILCGNDLCNNPRALHPLVMDTSIYDLINLFDHRYCSIMLDYTRASWTITDHSINLRDWVIRWTYMKGVYSSTRTLDTNYFG